MIYLKPPRTPASPLEDAAFLRRVAEILDRGVFATWAQRLREIADRIETGQR